MQNLRVGVSRVAVSTLLHREERHIVPAAAAPPQ
jgi:hypothetical protein